MRGPASALTFALGLALVACGAEPDAPAPATGTRASAIVDGTDSDASQDAVVLLMHYDPQQDGGGETDGCTGVMLAPTLVLTARHCVSITDDTAQCSSDGTAVTGGAILGDEQASTIFVFAGSQRPSFATAASKAPRGRAIVTDDAKTICNDDVALVLLDKPLDGARIAPVRLDAPPRRGEAVTVVGWGSSLDATFPMTRQMREGVKITAIGPAPSVGPAEFETGEAACAGDSGGPAFAASGAVLGVLSRGGNGSGASGVQNCIGAANVFSSLAPHADLIRAAYAKAGQAPWLEGQPSPLAGKLGASCNSDDLCQSTLCDMTAGVCTQACDPDPCPGGWGCKAVDGRNVCVQDKQGGGCATAPERGAAVAWAPFAVCALFLLGKLLERIS